MLHNLHHLHKYRFILIGVLTSLLIAVNVFATTDQADMKTHAEMKSSTESGKAVNALAQKLKNITSMQGRFAQVISDHEGEDIQISEGHFKVRKPGLFFWQVLPPYEQTVMSDGNSLTVYDPDLEQATVYSDSSWQNTPASILSGDVEQLEAEYTIALAEQSKHEATFELTPKEKEDNAFEVLRFSFFKEKLSKLSFLDKLGQTTTVDFSKVKINKPIADKVFAFDAPEGTDVIVND